MNVERAVLAGDSLGGHNVSGHVDGMATVAAIDQLALALLLLALLCLLCFAVVEQVRGL